MGISTTPLGFKKPDGRELVRNMDNIIGENAQRTQDLLGQALPDINALKALGGLAPGDVSDAVTAALVGNPETDTGAAVGARLATELQTTGTPANAALSATIAGATTDKADRPLYSMTPGPGVRPLMPDTGSLLVLGSSSEQTMQGLLPAAITKYGWGTTVVPCAMAASQIDHNVFEVGALEVFTTFPANTVPASGSVVVTVSQLPTVHPANMRTVYGVLDGTDVGGTLTGDAGTYTFVRSTPGAAVSLTGPVRFRVLPDPARAAGNLDKPAIISGGKNTIDTPRGAEKVIAGTQALIDALTPARKLFVLLGLHANQGSSFAHKKGIAAVNTWRSAAAARYGMPYVGIGEYVTGSQVWTDTGITPDAANLAAQAAGELPPMLASDALHLSAAAMDAFVLNKLMPALATILGQVGPGTVLASDSYAGTGVLSGRLADAFAGGDPVVPVGTALEAFARDAGKLKIVAASSATLLYPSPFADVEASAKFDGLEAGFALAVRVANTQANVANSAYRATVQTPTTVRLEKRFNGAASFIAPDYTVKAGDRIGVRAIGTQISLMVNGTAVQTVTDADVTTGSYAGFSKWPATMPAIAVDDLTVTRR